MTHTLCLSIRIETQKKRKIFLRSSNYNAKASFHQPIPAVIAAVQLAQLGNHEEEIILLHSVFATQLNWNQPLYLVYVAGLQRWQLTRWLNWWLWIDDWRCCSGRQALPVCGPANSRGFRLF